MPKKKTKLASLVKLTTFLAFLGVVAIFYLFDLKDFFDLNYLKSQAITFANYYKTHPTETALVYAAIYISVTGFSLPGAAALTLLGGALFPFWFSLALVSISSTTGATIALLVTRYLYRDIVKKKFSKTYQVIQRGFSKEGALYLFSLRLVPLFPFFLVNTVFAITPIRTSTFFFISMIGMLPGTVIYINAGHQLANIQSLSGILSSSIILSFTLLGIFPFIAKWCLKNYKNYLLYKKYKKPKKFDYNLVVIGGGAAGLVSSYIAAASKAKVLLVEENKMGGDCLNSGCVPSKALLHIAQKAHTAKKLNSENILLENGKKKKIANLEIDFKAAMQYVKKSIAAIEPHDSVERYQKLGVVCSKERAILLDPYRVKVGKKIVTTRSIIVATGATAIIPNIPGVEKLGGDALTSDTLWKIDKLPKRLVIVGGGAIGCEMAQAFSRLGSLVTLVETREKLLALEDDKVSQLLCKKFKEEGIELLLSAKAIDFSKNNLKKIKNPYQLVVEEKSGKRKKIFFDKVLFAVGRKPNSKNFGLEELKIATSQRGHIAVNEYLQTDYPNILACGDVAGPYQLTHAASHQAWYASLNALFGHLFRSRVDYSIMPRCTYTTPEVATVGLTEDEAKAQNKDYEVTEFELRELDRAILEQDDGFIRVLTPPCKDEILGVTIVSKSASTMILEFISTMKHKKGLNSILGTIHLYPSMGEGNKYVASKRMKKHSPTALLNIVRWFNNRRLG